jgi:hypothetical protein
MRVIYVEALAPGEDASDALATVLIDADASQAFFGDRWRLSEDILSNGAADCIQKLPPLSRDKSAVNLWGPFVLRFSAHLAFHTS